MPLTPTEASAAFLCMDGIITRLGSPATDPEWDAFLERIPQGHFEQSSAWAAAKAVEGWQCSRVELSWNGSIVGGFQILLRGRRPSRIGYISKGPVIPADNHALLGATIRQVESEARRLGLFALLVQPPEQGHFIAAALKLNGFLPNHLRHLIEASALIRTEGGFEKVLLKMRRMIRKQVRQGRERGVTIREGKRSELSLFFDLMTQTCRRQGNVAPVPSSPVFLQRLWDNLHDRGRLRLTFAEFQGRTIAGLICIAFGDRVTFWKKGWDSSHGECHPNSLLHAEALEWACGKGFRVCDFASLDLSIARTLLEGRPLTLEQQKTRHFFNLCFGASPVLLPESSVWFPNPFLHKMYSFYCGARARYERLLGTRTPGLSK